MHPFHKGHKELVCDVMRKTKQITDMDVKATAYIYLSATNEESRWITNENITNTMKSKTPQEKRALKRQINKIKARIGQSEPLPTSYRFAFLHKMLKKNSCVEEEEKEIFPDPIVLYDQSVTSLAKDLQDNFSNGKELTSGSRERLSVPGTAMVRDSYGNLPSLKCLNYLHKQRHNKVILLVGSDRVEAFKKYNMEKMIELFGKRNAFILQSGGERGDSGEGDKALDELEVLFANMSLDDDNSGESKVPVREDYSGSLSRKKALGNKNDIKQFLHMIDYTPGDSLDDIHKLIIKIRQANRVSILGISKKIRAAVNEIDDDSDVDKFAEQFVESGEERKKLRQQRGFGRTKKRKKRKRCSKKRLKKNMICHKGTKKKLRKLRKLTKKLKIRLTRCSKKRLKKWKVKKSRKKM
tara:strand:- start:1392 stop:2624 length:1233 start_codon:yes stop_codon:yes gene_type:complete